MTPLVSIVIVDWRGVEDTRECLNSIVAHCTHSSWEVLIVDNNDHPLVYSELLSPIDPRVRIISNKRNVGFAVACNQGFEASSPTAEYILFLNNDTLLKSDLVAQCLSFFKTSLLVGAVSPCIDYFEPVGTPWFHGSMIDEASGLAVHDNTIAQTSPKEVPWLTGCSFFVRKDVFRSAGMFDESLFMYCEDVDVSIKIRKSGHKLVLLPDVSVVHKVSASAKRRVFKSLFFDVRNKFIMCNRHFKGYGIKPHLCVLRREVLASLRIVASPYLKTAHTSIIALALICSLLKK
jgi:GT2 family glycosyltransferase